MDVTNLRNRRAINRWDRVSVGDLFERVVWSFPDKEAIVAWEGAYSDPALRRVTYSEADRIANQVAGALLARGVEPGQRVLMFCENSTEAYLTKIGIAKAGMTCVPLNPLIATDVLAYLIGRSEPSFTFVDASLWPAAQTAFTQHGLTSDVTIELGGPAVPGSTAFADFIRDASDAEPEVEIHGDDIWEIIYTSGTTAMPKGAMVSHTYSYLGGYAFALTHSRGAPIECDLKLLSFLPLIFHIADQIMSFPAFLCGGTLVIGRSFNARQVAAAIDQERPTSLWGGSPAMIGEVVSALEAGGHDPTSLKLVIYGWTAAHPDLIAKLKRLAGQDLIAVEILGQTEAIACHRFWPDKWPEIFQATAPETNYVGVPCPIVGADLWDAEGNSLRGTVGVQGEVVYRSPVVTAGYYKDEEATRNAFRGGWFHSGDVCEYDADGLRIMVDRSKDIVKSGGENVSSLRVESVLVQHDTVAKAAVVGLPHDRWGEAVTAFVIPTDGSDPRPEELLAFCRTRLAGFESPKQVIVVPELPVTVGGKVLKYKLRDQYGDYYNGKE